jgi:hypothetical protein
MENLKYRYRHMTVLLSGVLLDTTRIFPVMEQAERHIIAKKLLRREAVLAASSSHLEESGLWW